MGAKRMYLEGITFDRSNMGAVLASRAGKANIARILRRWTGSRRPAVLFVLVGETPFADVYAEEVLVDIFPAADVLDSEPPGHEDTRTLRVFVADKWSTTVYMIEDPGAFYGLPSRSDREPVAPAWNALEPRTARM
jgi:hypothetical protein